MERASTDVLPSTTASVFISYSRKDMAFVDRLEAGLKARGFEPLIDRTEIYAFEDWWKRIESLIARADTVIFVLSPDAIVSEVAQKEVEFAVSLNKRFAPVVCRRVDHKAVPQALSKLNFVFFDDEARFEESADRLADALGTDIDWIRQHTDFGEQARRWSMAGRPSGLLLRSPLLEQAERWIANRPSGAPVPTEETQAFLHRSRQAATRRRNILTGSLAAGLVIALVVAGFAYWQRGIAVAAEKLATEQKEIAGAQRDRAERTLTAATQTADSLVNNLARHFRNRSGIPISLVRDILDRARGLQQQLSEAGEISPAVRRSEAAALAQVSTTLLAQGDAPAALDAARRELEIMEELVAFNADNRDWQRARAAAYEIVANASLALGRQRQALADYDRARAVLDHLTQLDEKNETWQSQRASVYRRLGTLLVSMGRTEDGIVALRKAVNTSEAILGREAAFDWRYELAAGYAALGEALAGSGHPNEGTEALGKALALRQALADAQPDNDDYKHEIFRSLLLIGDVQRRSDHPEEAIGSLEKAFAIIEPIAARDLGNSLWQGGVSTVHQYLGDTYYKTNNYQKASYHYEQDLLIRQKLVDANPERADWQEYLGNARNRIGDLRTAEKKYDEALKWYRDALILREELIRRDPNNSSWRANLAGEYMLMGPALLKQNKAEEAAAGYRKAADIYASLAKSDVDRVSWEQSAMIAFSRLANVLDTIPEKSTEAIATLQESVSLQKELVAARPGLQPRRANLAITYVDLGSFLAAAKRLDDAVVAYRESVTLLEKLIEEAPENLKRRLVLSVAYARLGELRRYAHDRAGAVDFYKKALALREELARAQPKDPDAQFALSRALINLGDLDDEPEDRYLRALQILDTLARNGTLPAASRKAPEKLRTSVSGYYAQEGRSAFYAGDFQRAVRSLATALKANPADHLLVVWLHLARLRSGEEDGMELQANASYLTRGGWPWPIVAFFLGEANLEGLFASAKTDDIKSAQEGRLCEANFYVGIHLFDQGKSAEGAIFLKAAEEKCPSNFLEKHGAQQELKRLNAAAVEERPPH